MMKWLINNPEDVVVGQLKGSGAAHSEIEAHIDQTFVNVAGGVKKRVAVIPSCDRMPRNGVLLNVASCGGLILVSAIASRVEPIVRRGAIASPLTP